MEALQLLGGRYRLEERVGAGGMSVVWRATDEVLRRPVAVKVLAGPLAAEPGARLRIQAEARAAARLAHPHVAAVYDYGESSDAAGMPVPFVVMELLRGPTLSQRLGEGPLLPVDALRICAEVASGIAAAHDTGLVHRDIKPANVLLTPAGAKVVDFGIAAAAGPLEDLDEGSRMVGTPAYLAPERVTGGDVVPASDVYALGLLLYAVLVRRLPWEVDTTTQMLKAHVYVEPEPLPPVPGVPTEVVELCHQCLAKDPDERPSTWDVAAVLARAAGVPLRTSGDGPPPTPAPPLAAPEPSSLAGELAEPEAVAKGRPNRYAIALVAAAAVAVAAVTLTILLGGSVNNGSGAEARVSASGKGSPSPSPGAATADPLPSGGSRPGAPPATGTSGGVRPGAAATPESPLPGGTVGPRPSTSVEETPPPTGAQRTLTSSGGTVVAECLGTQAHALSWEPAEGYTVFKDESGPADLVRIWFKQQQPVKMNIRCVNGVPTLD